MGENDDFHRAIELSKRTEEEILDLGRCLARLKQAGEFRRFLGASGMGSRKAYYLIGISSLFDPLGVPEERLKRTGWTKLQAIADHIRAEKDRGEQINAAMVEGLLDLAERSTTQQLKTRLRNGKADERTRCVLLYFSPEQYQRFEEAVLVHGAERSGRGLIHKEEAVIEILRHAHQNGGETSGSPVADKRAKRRSR